ncbi:hypothetical protein Q1695_005218 [Nippostrongylus brasiliensis]|nr:hypothetical protein Q1695_005218 [Nippostrongylus brasiliensis]
MRLLVTLVAIFTTTLALTCYEGTVEGLTNNTRTEEKHCSGISNYCIQRIDKRKNQMIRQCSSFSDEHNMEEKCPMSGCHWQSAHETFCCCQFDHCNEWKSDGTEYKKGETVPISKMKKTAAEFPTPPSRTFEPTYFPEPRARHPKPTSTKSTQTDEIRLD